MTKKYFKNGNPTVRNRSAVIHADITLKFISKDQCDRFVKEYLKTTDYPSLEIETIIGDSLELDQFLVTITDVCWGHNLTRIGKIAEKYDYSCE